MHGVAAALSLAAAFTLFGVQWSLSRGRLSQDITYDDSSYFFEAGRRLAVLYDKGVIAYFVHLWHDMPHAPFTDVGAELAFSVFGFHDWVPYVFVNGPVILLLLLAVAYVGRALGLRARVAMMVLALSIPLSAITLQEYRPDSPGALFTALGIYLVAEAVFYRAGRTQERQLVIGGLFFGAALVTKAVFFAHTMALEALTIAGVCAWAWWSAGRMAPWGNVLRRSAGIAARVALPSLLVAGPYFIVNFQDTFGYFYDYTFGKHSHVAELKGGLAASAYFYTLGYAGSYTLGGSFFVGLALYALCLGCIAWSKDWKELLFQGFLLLVAGISFGAIVLNRFQNHYFGIPAETLLLFVLLRAIAAAWSKQCVTPWRAGGGLALLGGACAVNLCLLNPAMLWALSIPQLNYVVQRDHSLNQRILDDLWREFGPRAAVPADPPLVFVTRGGSVTAPTFRWMALKCAMRVAFADVYLDNDLETYRKYLHDANFVVAAEENAAGLYNQNSAYDLRFEVNRLIAANPALRLLRRYPTSPGGPAYELFVNDDKMLEQFGGLGDLHALEGFLPMEGPYPQWNLGTVRWAIGPQSRFTVSADATGDALIRLSVRADQPVRATLRQRGVPVLTIDTPQRPGFQSFSAPVKVQAGENEFVLTCESPLIKSPDGYERTLLFRQLDVVTKPADHAP